MAQIKVNFSGAPPVTGGGFRDHIPQGRYRMSVASLEDTTSKSGKRMISGSYKVSYGEHTGANLGDNFVLEDNDKQPSKMGLGKLHHFLLCLGLPVREGPIAFDSERITGLEFEADVVDENYNSNGEDRVSSNVRRYYPVSKPQNGNGSEQPSVPEVPADTATDTEAKVDAAESPWETSAEVSSSTVEDEVQDLFK